MLRSCAGPLLPLVQLSSQRTLEPVRKDRSFAEKQQPQPASLLVVRGGSKLGVSPDARILGEA
jgi:hypothetical protein